MDFFETVKKRYSCRSLEPVDISQEHMEKILNAGKSAASGWNKQPFDFLVVKEREGIDKIADSQAFISGASVVIGIIANPDASQYWREDIAASAENMLLAVTALGYGSTWVEGTILPREEEMKKYFGIPENLRFIVVLPIGKPATGGGSQSTKRDLDDMVHHDKW